MSNPNFAGILDLPMNEIKEPALIPTGTYRAMLGQFKIDVAKNENQTPFCEYPVTLISPEGDVDETEFADFGGIAKLAKVKQRLTLYLTEDSLFRAKEFVANTLGLGEEDAPNLRIGFQAGVNQTILVTIGHRLDKKTNKPRAEITGTAPVA